jgi:hypothetical protein
MYKCLSYYDGFRAGMEYAEMIARSRFTYWDRQFYGEGDRVYLTGDSRVAGMADGAREVADKIKELLNEYQMQELDIAAGRSRVDQGEADRASRSVSQTTGG